MKLFVYLAISLFFITQAHANETVEVKFEYPPQKVQRIVANNGLIIKLKKEVSIFALPFKITKQIPPISRYQDR